MELFTIVVLCYRNWEFLTDAISSVLQQNYPQIELIVSDDASEGFPEKDIEDYIEAHKSENIKKVLVRTEKVNVGTVCHLNHNVKLANGKYICFLAADDMFATEHVLSQYVDAFVQLPDNTPLVMAHTAMYNRRMDQLESYYLTPYIQSLLEPNINYKELYKALCFSPCLPTTSTCYTKMFFDKFGLFDESYKLIEDYPLHLRIAREKIPMGFSNFLAIKHRDGGISHGGTTALSTTKISYYKDYERCCQSRLSSLEMLNPKEQKKVKRYTKKEICYYERLIESQNRSLKARVAQCFRHPIYTVSMLVKILDSFIGKISLKAIIISLSLMCVTPALSDYLYDVLGIETSISNPAIYLFLFVILFVSIFTWLIHVLNCAYKRINHFPLEWIYLLSR